MSNRGPASAQPSTCCRYTATLVTPVALPIPAFALEGGAAERLAAPAAAGGPTAPFTPELIVRASTARATGVRCRAG